VIIPFSHSGLAEDANSHGFAYALAKATGLPLLFKGSHFTHKDTRPAIPG
jgi:uncharacterized protein with PIN domain